MFESPSYIFLVNHLSPSHIVGQSSVSLTYSRLVICLPHIYSANHLHIHHICLYCQPFICKVLAPDPCMSYFQESEQQTTRTSLSYIDLAATTPFHRRDQSLQKREYHHLLVLCKFVPMCIFQSCYSIFSQLLIDDFLSLICPALSMLSPVSLLSSCISCFIFYCS